MTTPDTLQQSHDLKPSSPFWYWVDAPLHTLLAQLTARPVERLELHINDGHPHFQVVYKKPAGALDETNDPPPVNDSFICPPICPT